MLQLQVQLWMIRLMFEDLLRVGVLVAMIALVGRRVMVWEVLMQQERWRMKMWLESLVRVVVEVELEVDCGFVQDIVQSHQAATERYHCSVNDQSINRINQSINQSNQWKI